MALTYDDSAKLMTDFTFKGRVKTACLKFAAYIMDEDATTAAHNTRFRWAQQCYQNPDNTAGLVQPPTVMDPAVQAAGAQIDDASLQTAVEDVVGQLI